jgi:hypothetical protein
MPVESRSTVDLLNCLTGGEPITKLRGCANYAQTVTSVGATITYVNGSNGTWGVQSPSVGVGAQAQISNGTAVRDLGGPFYYLGASAGCFGVGGFTSDLNQRPGTVNGGEFGPALGIPDVEVHYGKSETIGAQFELRNRRFRFFS